MKKILLLSFALLLSTAVRAADGDTFTEDGFTFTVTSEENHEVAISCPSQQISGIVTIPSYVTNDKTGVNYTVTSIPRDAFYYCRNMYSVTIPNSVTTIETQAFRSCNSLNSVTIPNSVIIIGVGPFYGCTNLTEINVDESNNYYCCSDNILYNKDKSLLIQCPGSKTEVTIPNTVNKICDYAFAGCSKLQSVVIPNSVTSIGNRAFYNCSKLQSIEIPNSLISIGDFAVAGCSNLTSVTIPKSVNTIGGAAFACANLSEIIVENGNEHFSVSDGILYNKNLSSLIQCPGTKTEVNIPNSVTSIANGAFYSCHKLSSIIIPNSVTSIGDYAFAWCSSLTSINIPNSITEIKSETFFYCTALTSIDLPDSVNSLGDYVFSGCGNLTSLTIPQSCKSIGDYSFVNCKSLTSVLIPSSCISIGNYAFNGCSELTSVLIPNSCISIGNYAFSSCSGLTSITIPNSVSYLGEQPFANCSNLKEIIVEEGNHNYCSLDGVLFNKDITILFQYPESKDGIEYIIPATVTSISNQAFYYCSTLSSITIPDATTEIGDFAFYCCRSLRNVIWGNSLKSIGADAFNRSGLSTVSIPNSVISIGERAFYGSTLTSISVPAAVKEIGNSAFGLCYLRTIYYAATEPITADYNVFFSDIYGNATLYVPETAIDKCKEINPWKNFNNIEAYYGFSRIENVDSDIDINLPYEVYTTNGIKIADTMDNLVAGIYLICQGKIVKKICIK